jgi:hypothetical protein
MYVDYMDYGDDLCLSMFTFWQHRRIRTALNGPRSSLKTSGGCGQNVASHPFQSPVLDLDVYPNPAHNEVNFRIHAGNRITKGLELQLHDALGREILLLSEIKSSEFSIATSGLNSGIYFYTLHASDGAAAHGRLIIQ